MTVPPESKLRGNLIADTSIRQPIFVLMLMLLAIVIGGLAYTTLPVNLIPDIDLPTVSVVIPYPGAGPESMADQVAKPVEDQLKTLSGVKHITSSSIEGVTTLVIEFESNINGNQAMQDVRDKVNATIPTLPRDVQDPIYQKFDPNQQPILTVAITSQDKRSPLELRTLVDDEIVPRLQQAGGVGSVSINGGQVRQINVWMDLNQLSARSVLPGQISQAIDDANANQGLGTIHTGAQDIGVRAPSMLQTPQDIERVQITGTPYRVSDVATVEDGVAEDTSYARFNGQDTVVIDIRRQSGTNIVQVADAVEAQMQSVFASYPDLRYTVVRDQSTIVRESVNGSIEELIIAAVAALVVVLLFFRDLRNTLTTVAGLPVIIIATFAAMSAFGVTLNVISLLSLSISVGLVIDDAIVVRENIFRHLERGETPMVAASRGTAQVAVSVLAMTLTMIAVFLPVALTGGVTGFIFKAFGITVASAMAISLIEAFTLAPMLSARLFKQRTNDQRPTTNDQHRLESDATATDDYRSSFVIRRSSEEQELLAEANEDPGLLGRLYGGILRWSLRRRALVVVLAVVVLIASGWAATGLKFAFFPNVDQHQFSIAFELPPGSPLGATDKLARQAEAVLMNDPAVESVQTTVGGAGTPEKGTFWVVLHEDQATIPFQERLRPQLAFLPTLAIAKPSVQGPNTDISGRDVQLSVQTTRPLSEIQPQVQQLLALAQQHSALTDIDVTSKPGKPEIRVQLDPAKAGDYGYTNSNIARSVRALINGDTATTFRQNGKDTDVVVRLPEDQRASPDSIASIEVPAANGNVPLTALANVEVASGPTTIRRYDRLNQIVIGANVSGRNTNEVVQELQAGIAQLNLPKDITTSFVGQQASQNEGFSALFVAMALSVLFVYMVLASQFGSLSQPLVIMLAMPFSLIGAFLALQLTGLDLSLLSMIGLIMLMGLVVKNSILLVDFAKQLQRVGMDKHTALERAGMIRLRPILMTTLALIGGAIPSAIGIGEGAELRRPLAVVIIGGVLTSLILTLLVVPTAYSLLEGFNARLSRLFRRQPQAVVPALALAGAVAGSGATREPTQHNGTMENHPRPSGAAGNRNGASVEPRASEHNLTTVAEHTNTTQENQ
jgi:hydrophobic/amphiphilic exporter-1 (mainly G- bacteria), HAE1 family